MRCGRQRCEVFRRRPKDGGDDVVVVVVVVVVDDDDDDDDGGGGGGGGGGVGGGGGGDDDDDVTITVCVHYLQYCAQQLQRVATIYNIYNIARDYSRMSTNATLRMRATIYNIACDFPYLKYYGQKNYICSCLKKKRM